MSKRYRMVDCGYPTFKKICKGRKWVGKVMKLPDGFLGKIANTEFKSKSEDGAFGGVVAKHLGYGSQQELGERNRVVRKENEAKRQAVTFANGQDMFKELERIMDATFERPKERE